jgi:hypothetical protein
VHRDQSEILKLHVLLKVKENMKSATGNLTGRHVGSTHLYWKRKPTQSPPSLLMTFISLMKTILLSSVIQDARLSIYMEKKHGNK